MTLSVSTADGHSRAHTQTHTTATDNHILKHRFAFFPANSKMPICNLKYLLVTIIILSILSILAQKRFLQKSISILVMRYKIYQKCIL